MVLRTGEEDTNNALFEAQGKASSASLYVQRISLNEELLPEMNPNAFKAHRFGADNGGPR